MSADWLGLDGARVLIAGAGGIGGACAVAYARAGASVAVVDRDQRALDALGAELAAAGARHELIQADLTEHGSGERVVAEVVERLGGLDVMLHAVGINDRRPILEFTEDEWDHILRVNLSSVFGLAQAAGRHMVEQGYGRVLALSSVSGLLAHHSHGPYAASKGGINQLLRVMAREWACFGRHGQRAGARLHRDPAHRGRARQARQARRSREPGSRRTPRHPRRTDRPRAVPVVTSRRLHHRPRDVHRRRTHAGLRLTETTGEQS